MIINEQINAEIIETVEDWTSEILVAYGVKKPIINDILIDETDVLGLRDIIYNTINNEIRIIPACFLFAHAQSVGQEVVCDGGGAMTVKI